MPKYEGKNRFSKQHNLNILSVDNFINQKVQILDSLFKKNHVMIEKFHNRITCFYSIIYVWACTVFHKWKYSVINLILPNSKQLLWHFFTNKQVDVLGDFNLEFWYILLFEVRFWIFRISFFAQNGDNSKGYPLENLKSHHLWFEKCFLITKCIKISVIKIISKLT